MSPLPRVLARRRPAVLPPLLATAALLAGCASPEPGGAAPPATPAGGAVRPTGEAEAGILDHVVQLTTVDRFLKAGEQYVSPDGNRIIFQAVPTPPPGEEPEEHYQMFVGELERDAAGRVSGLGRVQRLSPPGSSNTCGWFHPTDPDVVIFGSTIVPPSDPGHAGYQREGSRYKWQFPKEMTIVRCRLSQADGTAATLEPLVADPDAYLAECALSSDGRWLVYCRRVVTGGERGGDLLVRDLRTGKDVVIAGNDGYDGGPFFSPDDRRVCFRSDRRGNDLLQIFVAELAFDSEGNITGTEREFQLTDNEHVNWAPFWHPSGRWLLYTTSEMGHTNYEVFVIDADPGDLPGHSGPTRYGTRKRRVTFADGFDGLPAFDASGEHMIWTAQRDAGRTSQIWYADFVMPLDR